MDCTGYVQEVLDGAFRVVVGGAHSVLAFFALEPHVDHVLNGFFVLRAA